jgi:hypothetical protein
MVMHWRGATAMLLTFLLSSPVLGEAEEPEADPPPVPQEVSVKEAGRSAASEESSVQEDKSSSTPEEVSVQEAASTSEPEEHGNATPDMDLAAVVALVEQQQAELATQREKLAEQERLLENLTKELDALRAPAVATVQEAPAERTPEPEKPEPEPQVADATGTREEKTSEELRAETGDAVVKAQVDDPTKALIEEFPGAWRLPGTQAALAIGGFVRSTAVYNFDPLEITDRFIVGSIPVTSDVKKSVEAESGITADQSRLNFDLREPTDVGILRAFIEGDFASSNSQFRLRHAFGQWRKVLMGKTWSGFVDTQATPEEVDFEGLNGRVNVRQSQARFSNPLGDKYQFQLSLEDPNPEIQNGRGVTRMPDLVLSGNFQPRERLHARLAILGRQIRAQRTVENGGGVEKEYAWGVSVSGRLDTPWYDERDALLYQINAGNGIGRYINDLGSVGNYDGIFDPENGDLELFDVVAGYVSWQHWWGKSTRSNFTLGAVDVDSPDFVEGDAYRRTIRASANIFWTPTPRIDVGLEYLWGERENEDGADGDAVQVQMSARYRF